jgi:outer membrane protein insertion porin family
MHSSSLFSFLLFSTAAAFAQVDVLGPSPAFEGRPVSAIDLIANPHRDVEPMRQLVVQKAGEPYSDAKVGASIKALDDTGQFDKVQVNVVAEISGLRLDFLLEPAYYLGVLDFSAATKYFSYTRLLQVVDLQDEDPYDVLRVGRASETLRRFLQTNGYFQVEVHPVPEIDDANELVNIHFAINLGKHARIGKVDIQGPNDAERSHLLHTLRSLRARFTGSLLKPGKPYTPERVRAAIALVKKTLSKQNRVASTVDENPPQYHADTNRADVSLKVDVGPVVNIQVTGARLSWVPFLAGRQKKKLIPIYSERSLDQDLIDEGRQNLIDYFQKKGFYDVRVSSDLQHQPDQILLVYQIDRGKKHKVGRITFRGNYAIPEKDLLAQVLVKKSHIWTHGSLSQKLIKKSVDNLQAVYRDKGYDEVKIAPQVTDREPRIDVAFDIEEGQQTLVDNVEVTGNQNIAYDQLTAPQGFEMRSGVAFSPRQASEDRNRISATYLNRGYLNVEVKTKVSRHPEDPHRVDITYAITEGQLVRVSQVVYLGQKRTRRSLIAKTTNIPPETPMRRGQLLEAESRLYDLNIFDWSSVGPRKPLTTQSDEEALVKVHESKRNEITYGVGFEVSHRGGNIPGNFTAGGINVNLGSNKLAPSQSTFASPRGSIEFNRRNMRGLGETASASLLVSRLDQRALATYTQPHFFGSQWSSLTSLSGERTTENPLFAARLGDVSFQVERLISRRTNTRLQVRYDFNRTALSQLIVPDLVPEHDRNVHLSTFSGTLIRDTRDKPLDAHRGEFGTLNLGITPTVFGSSASFAKLFGQYATYRPFHSIVFANSVRLGLAKAFSSSFVPTSQLFFSGGGTSLRSFPINEAGPQRLVPFCNVLKGQSGCVNVTVPVGGRQLFIVNSEIRFPLGLMKPLGGVLFYDGGNVYSAINLHNLVSNYTNTVGIGLRYATPIGPIRIDLGHNLNPVPGIKSTQYYITVGQAF